jgi:hypothetical protein
VENFVVMIHDEHISIMSLVLDGINCTAIDKTMVHDFIWLLGWSMAAISFRQIVDFVSAILTFCLGISTTPYEIIFIHRREVPLINV